MKNIMTIDLEEWFHANYHEGVFDNSRSYEVRVLDNTEKLLNLFSKQNVKATFFVLGYIAEKHKELIREIAGNGHEIASHGYSHELVYKQTKKEFEYDINKSSSLIENITNTKVKGYRAPSWSIIKESLWALELLDKKGFKYDSSIFPFKTYLYGISGSPRFTHMPEVNGKKLSIMEIPPSTIRVAGFSIPFSGGFYFRVIPYRILKCCIKNINNSKNPSIVYLHPREIDVSQPRLYLNKKESFIHYAGVRGCEKKLSSIIENYEFTSVEKFYNL